MYTILLVIPDDPLKKEFVDLLSEDFHVLTSDSISKGLQLLDDRLEEISATLINLPMEQKSGYHFIHTMNAEPLYASIPVIALSDHLPEENDMQLFDMGYSDLLTPPGLRQHLVKRIKNAIRAKDSFTNTEILQMLHQLPSNIFLKDKEGKYVFATQYWNHLKKDGKHWTIRGKTDLDIRKDKENALKAMEADKEILRTGKGTKYIIEENTDGVQEFLELIKQPVFDDKGNVTGVIALINDVTDHQLLKMELEKRSKTDHLTGLLNKGATEELIRMILNDSGKANKHCALMMIDADRFKNINDTYGHATGDKVLAEIGRIIHNNFKGRDVMGRIGGDEFMVLVRDISDTDSVAHLAETIQKELKRVFRTDEFGKDVSLSIGIALYPESGDNFDDLYKAADKALYHVKENGRGSVYIYG